MKKRLIFILFISFLLFIIARQDNVTEETITYFPIDPSIEFQNTNTSLTLLDSHKNNQFEVDWNVTSTLKEKTYLRQDISLLYVNGFLKGTLNKWELDAKKISQSRLIQDEDSGILEAISYHYAEIQKNENEIFSAQAMTNDSLYVISSKFSPLHSFRTPNSNEDKKWKDVIDKTVSNELRYKWDEALKEYEINANQYQSYPLSMISRFLTKPISGFTTSETNQIIGQLWEGLYKNYFLGIKKKNGEVIEPYNSTIPLIMISNDHSHLLVIFQTNEGQSIILRQNLPSKD